MVLGATLLGLAPAARATNDPAAGSAPPGPPSPASGAPAANEKTRDVLAKDDFRFCHDPKYPLSDREIGWCALVAKDNKRCPALHRACQAGATARHRDAPRAREFKLPDLGGIGRLGLWLLFGVLLAALVLWIGSMARGWSRPAKVAAEKDARRSPTPAADEARHAVERDVQALVERARQAASRGDFEAAVAHAYAALLRRLEAEDLISVDAASTNGDYLRSLARRAPDLSAEVRPVLLAVERSQFGGVRPDAGLFQGILARVFSVGDRLAQRRATTAGTLALLCLSLPLVGGCDFSERGDWDFSPSGIAGVVAFLNQSGVVVTDRLAPLKRLPSEDTAQIVLLPDAALDEEDWRTLSAFLDEGGHLVIAGLPDEPPAWLAVKTSQFAETGGLSTTAAFEERFGRMSVAAPVDAFVEDPPQDAAVLLRLGDRPYAIELHSFENPVVFIATRHLFSNAALAIADNGLFLHALLSRVDGPTHIVGELMGLVSPNPAASVGRGRLAPFLGQLAVLLLFFYLMKGLPFGRGVDPAGGERRRFVEHVAAVASQYRRARATRHALALWGAYVVDRLQDRLRLGGRRGVGALAEHLSARSGRPLGEMARLVLEARETDDSTPRSARRRRTEDREATARQTHAITTLASLLRSAEAAPRPAPVPQTPRPDDAQGPRPSRARITKETGRSP
jgi:hypothetical protein